MDSELLAERAAPLIYGDFQTLLEEFDAITGRARAWFEARNWHGFESDVVERLELYPRLITQTIRSLEPLLAERLRSPDTWVEIRKHYAALVEGGRNSEIACTYFNSVTRRAFDTDGVNPRIEFTSLESMPPAPSEAPNLFTRYVNSDLVALLLQILEDYRFTVPWRDAEGDAREIARRIAVHLGGPATPIESIDIVRSVFYRMKHAYLMGRIRCRGKLIPFVLPLLHDDGGISVDAVLLEEREASILFSFTRSYFHVRTECPSALVSFLRSILPEKPAAELYLSIGFHKHGKTEVYRGLARHLRDSSDRFETAEGTPGMVMLVFTLPSYPTVYKIIRDRFAYPKNVTILQVRDRYRLVFRHDRVGRLIEAQLFKHVRLPRNRFTPSLISELQAEASRSVRIDDQFVSFDHLYTERRVRPLNLYLREVAPERARAAVIDYGDAIKELAAANIFPGDFLPKNFGVTRNDRVVFYDYDELCPLTECRFRALPTPRTPEDELSSEPWFSVGPDDIFPEEFSKFLGIPQQWMETFIAHHGDLLTPAFWLELQDRLGRGEIPDVFPYARKRRLRGAVGK